MSADPMSVTPFPLRGRYRTAALTAAIWLCSEKVGTPTSDDVVTACRILCPDATMEEIDAALELLFRQAMQRENEFQEALEREGKL